MSLKIALTGSTGLVGRAITAYFEKKGDMIIPCLRPGSSGAGDRPVIRWDIARRDIDFNNLEGCDAVIHLAGANIAAGKWTPDYKKEILSSRVDGTKLIAQAVAKLKCKPKVFLSASAIGYYGPRGPQEEVTEASGPGDDYLAGVCARWEEATSIAAAAGIRTVNLRLGVVLDAGGGALAKMLPVFKAGAGGVLGHGRQVMSWVALGDIPRAADHIIRHQEISGPINLTSPRAVSNREFTRALARALRRPALLPVPGFVLRLLYGEMADALLLTGARVVPEKLTQTGFEFRYPEIVDIFKNNLK
jgi:uncharacterized protein (TIGR01777 family)